MATGQADRRLRSRIDVGARKPSLPPCLRRADFRSLHQPRGVARHLVDLDIGRVPRLSFPPGRHLQRVVGLGTLSIERGQEFVCNRSPPIGIKPQQMAVARNAVEQLELCASAGCDECPIVSAYKGLVVKLVIVRIQPELRNLVARAMSSIRIIWRGNRP
jgi:hypothetical protein